MYSQPVLIHVNVSNKQFATAEKMPPQRREVVVSGHGNCFYRVFALWKDDISDEKLEEIPRSSDTLIEKNLKVFEVLLFPSNFPWRILLRKARSRELR